MIVRVSIVHFYLHINYRGAQQKMHASARRENRSCDGLCSHKLYTHVVKKKMF